MATGQTVNTQTGEQNIKDFDLDVVSFKTSDYGRQLGC